MGVTTRYSDVNKLNKLVQTMLKLALADIKKSGVEAVVYETYRTQDRQNYLYCQGRTVAECVSAGISKKFAQQYSKPEKNKVTWTLKSMHTQKKAVDVIPVINGKLTWTHTAKEQLTIVKIMSSYGFECGVNWSKVKDATHYQVNGNFTSLFDEKHNNTYVTKAIQAALNRKIKAGLKVDGVWGKQTTDAVNKFRKSMKYKTALGQLGAVGLEALLK